MNPDALKIGEYTISKELFTKGMVEGKGPFCCTATCCLAGVYADVAERDKVMSHVDVIRRYMDETQPHDPAQWFETRESDDPDFPSGRCVGTREVNDKCAFLDKKGHCSLQVAAVGEGLHRWHFKPLYCVLYPIEITEKIVRFDDLLQDDEQCCSVSEHFQVPLFQACKDELTYLLGEDGFQTMQEHYRALQTSSGAGKESAIDE